MSIKNIRPVSVWQFSVHISLPILTEWPLPLEWVIFYRISIKTRLWLWKPFFWTISQFAVNNVWSCRNTDIGSSYFSPQMKRVNGGERYRPEKRFYYHNLVYAEYADTVNNSYQSIVRCYPGHPVAPNLASESIAIASCKIIKLAGPPSARQDVALP